MSYCRWSTNDFNCDLYVYQAEDGYVIHVAGNRVVGTVPPVPDILETNAEEWVEAYNKQSEFLEEASREPIALRYVGESFYKLTKEACIEKIKELRKLGYIMPDKLEESID